jgi:hypothetical protein
MILIAEIETKILILFTLLASCKPIPKDIKTETWFEKNCIKTRNTCINCKKPFEVYEKRN